jgi:putative holliday junction resolvase
MDVPRLLGIDHGEARIGLALTDGLGLMAHPLETVPTEHALSRIPAVVREKSVAGLVIGLPLRSDGNEGPAAERVRAFWAQLQPLVPPHLAIHWQDETHSTTQAHAQLRAAGRKTKQHRPIIDQAAAVIILQDYLDRLRGPEAWLLPDESGSHRW